MPHAFVASVGLSIRQLRDLGDGKAAAVENLSDLVQHEVDRLPCTSGNSVWMVQLPAEQISELAQSADNASDRDDPLGNLVCGEDLGVCTEHLPPT